MELIRHILQGSRLRMHIVFSLLILGALMLGLCLLYLSGFRFDNLASAFTDCLFFLFCIYVGRWLCTRWYLRRAIGQFILFFLIAIAGLSLIKYLLVRYVFGHPNAGFLEMARDVMPFFLVGLVMGVLLTLIRATVRKEFEDSKARTMQLESEFSLLQAQLSPHFLFNVLNTVYGISLTDTSRAPSLLLKLSALLRYSVYSSKRTFVPLKDEVEYLINYIEFEKIRMSDRLELATDIDPAIDPTVKIAPLVLIVFVENAFKHTKNTLNEKEVINISLKIEENIIRFSVSNSFSERKKIFDEVISDDGIGLANTRRRLDLMYNAGYVLTQHTENDLYCINLDLKIVHG